MNKVATQPSTKASKQKIDRPRLLIEEWLPAQAIGVECMREEGSLSAKPPTKYFHVWWARRPLTVSRAAVLASLLPSDFDRARFERLLGFYAPAAKSWPPRICLPRTPMAKNEFLIPTESVHSVIVFHQRTLKQHARLWKRCGAGLRL